MIAFGPFELWRSPRWSDGWKPRGFYRPKAKRLNHSGPPPHGVQFSWMRLHLVVWYRSLEAQGKALRGEQTASAETATWASEEQYERDRDLDHRIGDRG